MTTAEENTSKSQIAIAAWWAFKHLCEWAWNKDLEYHSREGASWVEGQVIGFGGSHVIDMLRLCALDFTNELTEVSLADLIEIALEKQLGEYNLGLEPRSIYGPMEMDYIELMHYYVVEGEGVSRSSARAAQKAVMRKALDSADLL